MAKVVGPLHSSEARGSVSSLTYNTWRGISTVKARAGPTTQYSDAQVALRAHAAVATAAWKAMTDAERLLWNHYADSHPDIDWTGNPQRLSGYNWYIRINVRRQLVAQAIHDDPPTIVVDYTLLDFAASCSPPFILFDWTDQGAFDPLILYIEFYIAGPLSAGRHPNLPEADRKGHIPETTHQWGYNYPGVGTYTVFARPVHQTGVVGVFQRASVVGT